MTFHTLPLSLQGYDGLKEIQGGAVSYATLRPLNGNNRLGGGFFIDGQTADEEKQI